MDQSTIDRCRRESKEYSKLAVDLLKAKDPEGALRASFYAGMREADAQSGEENLWREAVGTPQPSTAEAVERPKQPHAAPEQPTTASGRPTAASGRPSATLKQPTPTSGRPAAAPGRPATAPEQPNVLSCEDYDPDEEVSPCL